MGNDHSQQLSTQPKTLLHTPPHPPYATLIFKYFLREFYHYHKDGSQDYSKVNKLYTHKRAILIKLLGGLEYFEEGPFESYKGQESTSWSKDIEIHLNKENFEQLIQKPIIISMGYYNYFGSFTAEYTIKDWRNIILSNEDAQPLIDFKNKSESIYSELSLTLVGPFIVDLVGIGLPGQDCKQQLEILNNVEKYMHSSYLNETHNEWIQEYYAGNQVFERIFEKVWKSDGNDQGYFEWMEEHFKKCKHHWKDADNKKFELKPEAFEKLLVSIERQKEPIRPLVSSIDILLNREASIFDNIIIENPLYFKFMIKYLDWNPNKWIPYYSVLEKDSNYQEESKEILEVKSRLKSNLLQILQKEEKGALAMFFFQNISRLKYLQKLFALIMSFEDILAPYLHKHIGEFPKELKEFGQFKQHVLKEIPGSEYEVEALQAASYIHNFLFTPSFEAFLLNSEIYGEDLMYLILKKILINFFKTNN